MPVITENKIMTDDELLAYLRTMCLGEDISICTTYGKKERTVGKIEDSYGKSIKEKIDEQGASINTLQEKVNCFKDNQKEIENLKEELKKANGKIAVLQKRIKDMQAEHQELDKYNMEYMSELTQKIEELEKGQGVKLASVGKSIEVGSRRLQEVVRLFVIGTSISEISKSTGASRGQIERITRGSLKNPKSREKVLEVVNRLLRVNQNKKILEKLKCLKGLYSDGGIPNDKDRIE